MRKLVKSFPFWEEKRETICFRNEKEKRKKPVKRRPGVKKMWRRWMTAVGVETIQPKRSQKNVRIRMEMESKGKDK